MQLSMKHVKYRSDIDGLRALAVFAVVGFHIFPEYIFGGYVGVDIFFVISGYLISGIIIKNLSSDTFSFRLFYQNRIRRIFPALILVLASCLLFGWFSLFSDEYKQLGKHMIGVTTFSSNFFFWRESGYFDNTAETKPLLHLWSLAIEEQFYLIWPLLIWSIYKHRLSIIYFVILITMFSFFINIILVNSYQVADFYLPLSRFWELSIGYLLYYKETNLNQIKVVHRNIISIIGLLFILLVILFFNNRSQFPGWLAILPTLGAALLIYAGPDAWINSKILSRTIIVGIGLISYSLYLWHWPILAYANIVIGSTPGIYTRILILVISIFLSYITFKYIELPIKLSKNKKKLPQVVFLIASMTVLFILATLLYFSDGLSFRKSISVMQENRNELIRAPQTNEDCFEYIKNKSPLFPYCKYTNAHSLNTVAIIGDSHAHVAYEGLAELFKDKGLNTVLLANSGCPPYLGAPEGKNSKEKESCSERTNQILRILLSKKDIHQILIFTRGPVYTTGTEPLTGDKDLSNKNYYSINKFVSSIQKTIEKINDNSKTIYFITENPELPFLAEYCLTRPLRSIKNTCNLPTEIVTLRQKEYLEAIKRLKGVQVIIGMKLFCPDKTCKIYNDNKLLYADDDHLSISGSRFMAKKLLEEYIK